MKSKSTYLLAVNSISIKVKERLEATIEAYAHFKDNYPQSNYLKELENTYDKTKLILSDQNYASHVKIALQLKILKPLRKLIRHYKFDVNNANDFVDQLNFKYAFSQFKFSKDCSSKDEIFLLLHLKESKFLFIIVKISLTV